MYFARSLPDRPKADWQLLPAHLTGTAALAGAFGKPLGIERAASLSGLLHDLGKYTIAFQRRLEGSGEQVDHSTAGAWEVWHKSGGDASVRQLMAFAIAGHHAGLADRIGPRGVGASLEERLTTFDSSGLDPVWRSEINSDFSELAFAALPNPELATRPFQLSLLGRMLFSCLVDADRKDAAAFCVRAGTQLADCQWPELKDILDGATAAFEQRVAGFRADSPVNILRSQILAHTRAQADAAPGLFTFTVPTGGGKTLASLGFALAHARAHSMRRIIYVAPFTAIIDQTAAIYRDLFGEDVVLEHHSAVDEDRAGPANENENIRHVRQAMQDWAAPVIVTTSVQLFESLFAARPSKCQKLHNIAGSIIILDEAQTLPRHLLAPCMRVIDELARNYRCTVILCTATQPAFDVHNFPKAKSAKSLQLGLDLRDRELAPDPAGLAKALRRVVLRFDGARTNADIVREWRDQSQGLVIVNSRQHALTLYREAKADGLDGLVHLSTRQCSVDRKALLEEIRARLKAAQACRVVATSLVEAGVDLDFPRVWRASAGLDQIAQAAGRCNREGQRVVADSIVSVFDAPDFPPPAEIRSLTGDLSRILSKHADLFSPEAMADYFGEVYWRVGVEGLDREGILGLLGSIDSTGVNFAYRTAAEKFQMIENGMAPVIINRDAHADAAIRKLAIDAIPSGAVARELQSYMVQVPPRARARLISNGRAGFANPSVRGDAFCVLTDTTLYAPEIGLLWEDADYLSTESLFWS
jgi:CRISPR-associated endonuclease/helicase Cas3